MSRSIEQLWDAYGEPDEVFAEKYMDVRRNVESFSLAVANHLSGTRSGR